MATSGIYNLEHVDYSERGQLVEIIVDGVPKLQTVIFSGIDCFQENAVKEHRNKKELLAVVLKKTNINVVWNFYWLEDFVIPHHVEILQSFK